MKSENLDQTVHQKVKQEGAALCDDSFIKVTISEVLTPVTCAFLINEILQGLLYQKSQIPYPYSWLKSVVEKKRGKVSAEEITTKINFSAANHFRIVSTAYDTLETIMKAIINEFKEKSDYIKEVLFMFGTTPQCPKEIYSIKISSLAKGHLERNHANPVCKYRQQILRNIFLSQHWLDAVDNNMSCTNTYIFLKISENYHSDFSVNSNNGLFIPSQPVLVAPKVKHIKISLNYELNQKRDCCDNFFVFEDVSESNVALEKHISDGITVQGTGTWYQSKDLFKGFKDCYINRVSASELW